jgi:hypothetical protein
MFVRKNLRVLQWWNWQLVSISSTFYTRNFNTKVLFFAKNVTREMHFCFLVPKFCTKNARVKRWWNWRLVNSALAANELEPSLTKSELNFLVNLSKLTIRYVCLNITLYSSWPVFVHISNLGTWVEIHKTSYTNW